MPVYLKWRMDPIMKGIDHPCWTYLSISFSGKSQYSSVDLHVALVVRLFRFCHALLTYID